jgi:hypothetical protein
MLLDLTGSERLVSWMWLRIVQSRFCGSKTKVMHADFCGHETRAMQQDLVFYFVTDRTRAKVALRHAERWRLF